MSKGRLEPSRVPDDTRERATLSIAEAARRLGLTVRATRKAAAAGEIPAIQIRRRWLVLREPFEELLGRRGGSR